MKRFNLVSKSTGLILQTISANSFEDAAMYVNANYIYMERMNIKIVEL